MNNASKFFVAVVCSFGIMGCGKTVYKPVPGANGGECTLSEVLPGVGAPNGGVLMTCPTSSVLVKHGTNGLPGAPGADASEVEFMYPCGEQTHSEVLMKVGTTVYAVYSSGAKVHLVKLIANKPYVTTDGFSCNFKVDASGNLI